MIITLGTTHRRSNPAGLESSFGISLSSYKARSLAALPRSNSLSDPFEQLAELSFDSERFSESKTIRTDSRSVPRELCGYGSTDSAVSAKTSNKTSGLPNLAYRSKYEEG